MQPTPTTESRLLFRNDAVTPLGRLTMAGYLKDSPGVGPTPRTLGRYAIVYLLDGSGHYRDTNGHGCAVRAGDLLTVLPEVPHTYGPGPGERWSEFYVVFDGPAFDLLRKGGLLNAARPVRRPEAGGGWIARLDEVVARAGPRTLAERTLAVSRFLALLTEMLLGDAQIAPPAARPAWLERACEELETNLEAPLDLHALARGVGLPYETFRKQFQRHMGASPARYRAVRRIDTACALLQSPERTLRSVALSLGFSDEYHLSRRFKQITGLSPREFRRRLPGAIPGDL